MGLDTVELVMEVEEKFGIRIPGGMAEPVETVGALFELVMYLLTDSDCTNRRHCTACKYSLRGLTSNRCPECGEPFILSADMDREQVWQQLVLIISEQMAIAPSKVKPTSRFVQDLGMD